MSDNFTTLQTINDIISTSLGITSNILWIIILISFIAAIGIASYFYFGSIIISLSFVTGILLLGSITGIIPIWIVLLHFIPSLFYWLFLYNPTEPIPSNMAIIDYWEQYGLRLKEAYTAKFGGENKGFNDEVNKRVLVMQKLQHGFTCTVSRDWLQRMKKFTESK